jgi:hypothetical protein
LPRERLSSGLGLAPGGREIYVSVSQQQSAIVLSKMPGSAP